MSLYLGLTISSSSSQLTIASGEITVTGLHHTVASESGVSDTLSGVNIGATLSAALAGRPFFVILHAAQGHTITIDDGTASNGIYSFFGSDLTMTENEGVLLYYNPGTNEGWTGFGSPAAVPATETGTQTLTNKTLTAPIINSPTTKEAIATYASGAISAFYGIALLTGGSPVTYTLADPTASTHDGYILRIMSTTAQLHKVDNSAGSGFNAGGATVDFANFGGAIGDNIELLAYNGDWYVLSTRNVTIAGS